MKIASVNGELITGMEYEKTYQDLVERMRQQFKGYWNEELVKAFDLRNRALRMLIDQKLMSQESERLGIDVTEDEIQAAIMTYPAFQIDGRFDLRRYQAVLENNRMQPEDFEQIVAGELRQRKLGEFLMAFMPVADQEVRESYDFLNEKIKVAYVVFGAESFQKGLEADAPGLEAYFEANKAKYRLPEQIKLVYLELDPAAGLDEVDVPAEDIRLYYEQNLEKYSIPLEMRARHILFRTDPGMSPEAVEAVRQKAEKVLAEAQAGQDFAALAKAHSECPSASEGGDLGYFTQGRMDPAFEAAAFALQPGEMSGLVQSQFGYHIIRAEDVKPARTKPLEEVQDDIRRSVALAERKLKLYQQALDLIDRMPYSVDLTDYAAQNDLQTHTTEYFARNEAIPGLGDNRNLSEALFALDKGGTSEVIEQGDKFYIFQIGDKRAPHDPELAAVVDRVRADYLNSLAARKAEEAAGQFLQQLKAGADWDRLAADYKVTAAELGFFSRQDSVPQLAQLGEAQESLFNLGPEQLYPEKVYTGAEGAYVFAWKAREGVDEKRFEEEKAGFRFQLMQTRQTASFQSWLTSLREKAAIEMITPVS